MVGPMARPGAHGLGPGLGLKYEIVLRAGPGLDIIVAGRAGPGPHNSICGPGPGQVSTTAAGPGRAWASNRACGPGLGLDFRPVQGPNNYTVYLDYIDIYLVRLKQSAISFLVRNKRQPPPPRPLARPCFSQGRSSSIPIYIILLHNPIFQ